MGNTTLAVGATTPTTTIQANVTKATTAATTALAAPAQPAKSTYTPPVATQAPKVSKGELVGTLTTNEKHGKATDKEVTKIRVENVIGDKPTRAEAEKLAKQWSSKHGNKNVAIIKTVALVANKPNKNACECGPQSTGYHIEKRFTVAQLSTPVKPAQAGKLTQAGRKNSRVVAVGDSRKLATVGAKPKAKPAKPAKPAAHAVAQHTVAKAAPTTHTAQTTPNKLGPANNALFLAQLRTLWAQINKLNAQLAQINAAPSPQPTAPSEPQKSSPVQQFSPVQQTAVA